ncbi:NDP-hexose 2,3-dehydratase family protein [Streptomyces hygroscopicus]|uniref:NDP-hexose 2,3-dehydratase family protein n=1 Tax=Streptomyces hygroscopicus TaxID=1912 RepID=UPI0033D1339E
MSEADTPALQQRLLLSAAAQDSPVFPLDRVDTWLAARSAETFRVSRVPFDDLDNWCFEPGSGNLRHRTGRFFSIEGLRTPADGPDASEAFQPVIVQPEIGTLGILVREFDGIPHFLMQAKMEPGNINTIQVSPTVQATRSNSARAHGGAAVRYLEYFSGSGLGRGRGKVLVDVLQSEHGSYFLHKRNRHMVVETCEDIPAHEDFRWLTLGQIHRLLRRNHVINMDARTVLSCVMPAAEGPAPADPSFADLVLHSLGRSAVPRHTLPELMSWLTGVRAHARPPARPVPLESTAAGGWVRGPDRIERRGGGPFTVIGTRVEAPTREVTSWTQPLVEPSGTGVSAFVAARLDGVLHVLVEAREEPGSLNGPELMPTVHCLPGETHPYLGHVLAAPPSRVRYDVLLSEEGGRFHHARYRNLLVEAGDDFPLDTPDSHRWMTLGQLARLTGFGQYVGIQARTLLACAPAAM